MKQKGCGRAAPAAPARAPPAVRLPRRGARRAARPLPRIRCRSPSSRGRSEEHTSELQSPYDLVCRLLLEKKNESVDDLQPPALYLIALDSLNHLPPRRLPSPRRLPPTRLQLSARPRVRIGLACGDDPGAI